MSEKMQRLMLRQHERVAKLAADSQARQRDRTQHDLDDGLVVFQDDLEGQLAGVRDAIRDQRLGDAQQGLRSASALLGRSASLLASYTAKQWQQTVDGLDREIGEKMAALQPRAKFSFRSKRREEGKEGVVQAPAAPAPAAAAAAAANDDKEEIDALDVLLGDHRQALNDVTIQNRCGERYHHQDGDATGGRSINSITIMQIDSSVISITHRIASLRILSVQNSLIMVGPVAGSVYVENCHNCTLVFAARQVRIHKTRDVHVYMLAASSPIIEGCEAIAVAPFNLVYDGVDEALRDAGLAVAANQYDQVQDFHWLRDGAAPNWTVLDEERRAGPIRADSDALLLPNSPLSSS